jgi:hypothetical protein
MIERILSRKETVGGHSEKEMLKRRIERLRAGLPDFSWCNIPKRGKIYQNTIKYTKWSQSGHIIDYMYQHLPLQDPPKIYPNWYFLFENMSSGKPG